MLSTRLILGAALAAGLLAAPAHAAEDVVKYKAAGSFADAMFDLEGAIVNRGYVVDGHQFIGDMLKRTAEDVGAEKELYLGAEVLQFCSAVVSRAAMAANVENVAFCPYSLFAYEAADAPGDVYVGYRALPPGEGRDDVNALLDEMAKEAAGAN